MGPTPVLRAGMSRVRFPLDSLEFLIDTNLLAALWPADHLKIWEPQTPGTLLDYTGLYRDFLPL